MVKIQGYFCIIVVEIQAYFNTSMAEIQETSFKNSEKQS